MKVNAFRDRRMSFRTVGGDARFLVLSRDLRVTARSSPTQVRFEHDADAPPRPRGRRTGFSLLELLVTIGVIGILLSILLPALMGSKDSAERLVLLANQRESMRIVEAFAHDHDDRFPNFGEEFTFAASFEWEGVVHEGGWWSQPEYWGVALQSMGYDGWVSAGPGADPDVFRRDDEDACGGCGFGDRSIHFLTGAAFAEPSLFQDGRLVDKSLHVVQRFADVTHPSKKGVLDQVYFLNPPGTPASLRHAIVHFADGHGKILKEREIAPAADVNVPLGGRGVLLTKNGVEGRDV